MKKLYLDTETISDLDVIECGSYVYAEHPSTGLLILSFVPDNDLIVKSLDITQFEAYEDFLEACYNTLEGFRKAGYTFVSHNVQFDRQILEEILDFHTDDWYDTAAKARSLSLPESLEALCLALKLPQEQSKLKDGKELVKRYSIKQEDPSIRPLDWKRFVEYCCQDTLSMRICDKKMPDWNYRGKFFEQWKLDQKINRRGFKADLRFIRELLPFVEKELKAANQKIWKLTKGRISTINQIKKILEELDIDIPNLQKDTILTVLENPNIELSSKDREILELRIGAAKASVKKYQAFINRTSADGRIRGTIVHYGASRTGRGSGRGVQIQNFIRPPWKADVVLELIEEFLESITYDTNTEINGIFKDINWIEFAASALRSCIIASEGKKLLVVDLASIEARVLLWLAGANERLNIYRRGLDAYKVTASEIFQIPYDEVTSEQRDLGKVAVLALGYGQGVQGFINYCAKSHVKMDLALANKIVYGWRRINQKVVNFWYRTEEAAINAVTHPGKAFTCGKVTWGVHNGFLMAKLPSGRFLTYANPFIRDGQIHFWEAKKNDARKWGTASTYGGRQVENITQAVARDIMYESLSIVEEAGFEVLFTVHDEGVTEADINREDLNIRALEKLFSTNHDWCLDLPIGAKGKELFRYAKI